jgi:hypothetical protein
MTKNEYLTLSGEYCIKMGWNHDAIPELAKCLEGHDKNIARFLEGEKIARQYAIDKGVELQRENFKLREKVKNQARRIRFFEGATNHAGGVPKVWRDAPCPHCSGTGNAGDWVASDSALPNAR